MGSRVALTLGSLLAIPLAASAHPGHGLDPSGTSLLHWLGEPEHVLPLLGVACLAAVLWGMAALSRRSG
jgi:hypothetical protein